MNKEVAYIYLYKYTLEYYSATRNWNFAICNNMDGHRGYYALWNKSDRKTNTTLSLTCGIWKAKQMNITKNRLTDNREQTSGYQQVGGWNKGQDWWKRRRRTKYWEFPACPAVRIPHLPPVQRWGFRTFMLRTHVQSLVKELRSGKTCSHK